MSIAALQSWLLEEGILSDLNEVTKLTVRQEIANLAEDSSGQDASNIDWQRLLLAGSILARSNERPLQEAALRIATAAMLAPIQN